MIKADKGQHLKRTEFKARGRMGMRRKYRCHLTVRLPNGSCLSSGTLCHTRCTCWVGRITATATASTG